MSPSPSASPGDLKLVRSHVHDRQIRVIRVGVARIVRVRVIDEAWVTVEVERDRFLRIAVTIQVQLIGRDSLVISGVVAR